MLVFILLISGLHSTMVIDGFHSKESCETAYQQLVFEDLKTGHGTGWDMVGPEMHIANHDHICVGIIK